MSCDAEQFGRARRPMPLLVALLAAAIGLAIPLPAAAQSAPSSEPKTTLPDIEDEVMCPVCGTTLELASENKQANDQRDYIRGLIAEGRTKDEIKDALVAEFGEEVLATPGTEGFDLAAWLVPGLAIVAAGVAIFVGLRRWRARGSTEPPFAGTEGSAEEKRRLDADLERYRV